MTERPPYVPDATAAEGQPCAPETAVAARPPTVATEPLLEVQGLSVSYGRRGRSRGPLRPAVDGVTLRLSRGETLGLLGESGSGKSTIGNAILGLVRPTAGRIVFHGAVQDEDITHAPPARRRRLARHIQVVFQDPYGSLNPSRSIGQTLSEPLHIMRRHTRGQAAVRVSDTLNLVGLTADAAERYPAAFSGGQRQRIAVARALVLEPDLIVCDEPTSALDLSVQAHVLNLLVELQQTLGVAYLFVSHDLDVIRHVAHRAAVLRAGTVVEEGTADRLTTHPSHPYTRTLLTA
ncbi:ATP-binding cassette domain-containing protein [Streptomyces sp. NPDC006393]|uniref:ATP-binding cassette domain-containing protein n=1 Tax=Streptomyces sp. NPDC006393 TaxID=3156763 RepID=UPI0033DF0A29